MEIPLFPEDLGWWNILIWSDTCILEIFWGMFQGYVEIFWDSSLIFSTRWAPTRFQSGKNPTGIYTGCDPISGAAPRSGWQKTHQGASNHDSLKDSLARASFCQSQRFDRQKRPKAIYEGVQSNGAHPGEVFSVRFNDSKKSPKLELGIQ